jgi:hypothetical protein
VQSTCINGLVLAPPLLLLSRAMSPLHTNELAAVLGGEQASSATIPPNIQAQIDAARAAAERYEQHNQKLGMRVGRALGLDRVYDWVRGN